MLRWVQLDTSAFNVTRFAKVVAFVDNVVVESHVRLLWKFLWCGCQEVAVKQFAPHAPSSYKWITHLLMRPAAFVESKRMVQWSKRRSVLVTGDLDSKFQTPLS